MSSPEKPPVQLTAAETERLAVSTCRNLNLRLVLRHLEQPALIDREGNVFPDFDSAAEHLYSTFRDRCLARGGLPHSDWIPPSPPEASAPSDAAKDRMPDALGLIADLVALMKADSYPVAIGSAVLKRADAMLAGEDLSKLPKVTVVDRDEPNQVGDEHWSTVQELLNAMSDLPGLAERVDAYMRGRGIDDPAEDIARLRKAAF